jgi:hypothetical protein
MRVQDIIRAHKDKVDWGKPQQGGMTPSIFPLSKRKKQSLKLGCSYRWRLVRFDTLAESFRLLIAYHTLFENYEAYLAMEAGQDLRVIASLSYHGTHPGWHMHAGCGDTRKLPVGVLRHPWFRRLPAAKKFVRNVEYVPGGSQMNDAMALQIAAERFNLHNRAGDLFSGRG